MINQMIDLINELGARLDLKAIAKEEYDRLNKDVINQYSELELLDALKGFKEGRIIFNCDGGEGDFYYYLEDNAIRVFTPESIFDELTEDEIRKNGEVSLMSNIADLMYDIFLGETTCICEFET